MPNNVDSLILCLQMHFRLDFQTGHTFGRKVLLPRLHPLKSVDLPKPSIFAKCNENGPTRKFENTIFLPEFTNEKP